MKIVQSEYEFDYTNNICTPIFYDIYSKKISSDLDVEKSIRCEMFLESWGLEKPSQLIDKDMEIEDNKIDYFLKYLAVFQVMDASIYFDSTKSIEKERIAVCQYMAEKNPTSKESYSNEIKKDYRKFFDFLIH